MLKLKFIESKNILSKKKKKKNTSVKLFGQGKNYINQKSSIVVIIEAVQGNFVSNLLKTNIHTISLRLKPVLLFYSIQLTLND